ncbi:MAG: ATP-binding protein [Ornithinimicrobium sp.]
MTAGGTSDHHSLRLRTWGISTQEERVLDQICRGLSNQEIAGRCYLSINTVKTYIRSAYRKIGVHTRTEAVLWGLDHGLGLRPNQREVPDAPHVMGQGSPDVDLLPTEDLGRGQESAGPSVNEVPPHPRGAVEPPRRTAGVAAAVLGHELGTPLTAISASAQEALACLELDSTGSDPAAREEVLRRCLHIILRGTRAIEAVRADAARQPTHHAGPREPRSEVVSVRDHLESAAALTQHRERLIIRCHHQLTCRVQTDHLEQMLSNLIANAAKYTDGRILLQARREGHHVVVVVEDRGGGVGPSFRTQMFEPFTREQHDAGTEADPEEGADGDLPAPTPPGSGLGLYVVRRLARANHGEVRYDRASHGGSRFSVILPATSAPITTTTRRDHGLGPGRGPG